MGKNKNEVIVVNEQDEWLGTKDKMEAHTQGILHRAFSVFILNNKQELIIQKRALGKYHSGGLWSNTCCSHPAPGESTLTAAHRRLQEEMGFDCLLKPLFNLRYKEDVGNGMIENEYDHIYTGIFDGAVNINTEEVSDYQYITLEKLQEWMQKAPNEFTAWLHLAMPQFITHINQPIKAA